MAAWRILLARPVGAMATQVMGQTDPVVRISGLTLTGPLAAGAVAQCEFTATNTRSALIGEFVDREQVVTGCVVGPGNVVMAVFNPFTITTGPFGGPTGTLYAGDYALVHLTSTTPLPSQAAGQQATVFVGDLGAFAGVSVNQTFNPNLGLVLAVTKTVQGSATGTYKYPTSGSGGGIVVVGHTGVPKTFAGLTTTNWALIGAGAALLVGGVLVYRTVNPPEVAAAREMGREQRAMQRDIAEQRLMDQYTLGRARLAAQQETARYGIDAAAAMRAPRARRVKRVEPRGHVAPGT